MLWQRIGSGNPMLGLFTLGDRLFSFRKGYAKRKGHDSRAIANCFVDRFLLDGRRLDVLQLNKLVYLAHGWHLAHHGEPLICHQVLSWENGPMIREVYGAFRSQALHIREIAYAPESEGGYPYGCKLTEEEIGTINAVYETYADLSYARLSAETNKPDTPWHTAWEHYPHGRIPNPLIQAYHKLLAKHS